MKPDVGEVSDTEVLARYPHAAIDQDNKELYRGWLQHRLLVNRCATCGHWHHPPAPLCPKCWSTDVVPTEVAGRGVVYLLIRLYQGPAAPGVDYTKGPHPVVSVELAEQRGLRFTSTVVNCAPEDLRIGLPVQLTWIDRAGAPFPVFEPMNEKG
jgi:uncharacterized OB-fold protein